MPLFDRTEKARVEHAKGCYHKLFGSADRAKGNETDTSSAKKDKVRTQRRTDQIRNRSVQLYFARSEPAEKIIYRTKEEGDRKEKADREAKRRKTEEE